MSQTVTPPVADDIAFVLGLAADRQSAVLSALVNHLTGGRVGAAIPITADGHRVGTFVPVADIARYQAFLDSLPPHLHEKMTRPLPPDFDPTDWATDEELDALTAQVRARSR